MTTTTARFTVSRPTAAVLATLTAALLAGTAAPARADVPAGPAASVTVEYGDLNIGSDQGAQVLYARIVAAARQVCGSDTVSIRDLNAWARAQACEQHAIAQAVRDVHNPSLSRLSPAPRHSV